MLFFKSFIVWLILVIFAIINGTFREKIITPNTGEASAHVISTLIFITIIFIVTYFYIRIFNITASKELITIGLFWFFLTIVFEFVFGHFVVGHSWQKLLADYNIFQGRFWILVLLSNIFAPLICSKLI